jgi:hypothetical protein
MFDENGLGDYRADAPRTRKPRKGSDDMDEKDDKIAHLQIIIKPAITWDYASN